MSIRGYIPGTSARHPDFQLAVIKFAGASSLEKEEIAALFDMSQSSLTRWVKRYAVRHFFFFGCVPFEFYSAVLLYL